MKKMPQFANEQEEARWWFEHQDDLDNYLGPPKSGAQAEAQSELDRFAAKLPARTQKRQSRNITINMSDALLERARRAAEKKGMPYQTLLKSFIHEGLDRIAAE